jgi:hypothetical protein
MVWCFLNDGLHKLTMLLEPSLTYAQASINTYNGQISSSWYRDLGMCDTVWENVNATLSCTSGVISVTITPCIMYLFDTIKITKIDFASFGKPTGTVYLPLLCYYYYLLIYLFCSVAILLLTPVVMPIILWKLLASIINIKRRR